MSRTGPRETNYEGIAASYDRRYRERGYDDVATYLLQWLAPAPGLRVLELGCGTGHWLEIFEREGCAATGVDPSPGMLEKARARVRGARIVRGRSEAVPLPSRAFDRIVCVNALHHFADRDASLSEARRLLDDGGRLLTIGLDPHDGRDRWYVYEYFEGTRDEDRLRYPSTATIRAGLEAAGFTDVRSEVAKHMTIETSAEKALADGRVARTTTSQLAILTDAEYARGIEAIERAIAATRSRGEELTLCADLRLWATTASAGEPARVNSHAGRDKDWI